MACTEDDHDTTDMFCAACGVQLHEAGQCDWCDRGQHEGNGYPFCPCCGTPSDRSYHAQREVGSKRR